MYYFELVKHPICETSTPPVVILPELNDKDVNATSTECSREQINYQTALDK